MMVRLNGLLTSTRAVIVVTAVGTPGNQAANGENKHQPIVPGKTGSPLVKCFKTIGGFYGQ
jgi:hypothetical protein